MKVAQKFIVIDCETSGFFVDKNVLTEVAFVVLDGITLEEVDSYTSYVKPYKDNAYYSPDAVKLTGITRELCEEKGQPLEVVIDDMNEKFKKHKVSYYFPVLVMHNGDFDRGFLSYIYDFNYGPNQGKYGKSKLYDFVQDCCYDTMIMSRQVFVEDEVKDFKLNTIGEHLGFLNQNAHEALADVRVTADIFRYFILRMRNGGSVDMSKFSAGKNFNFQF